MPIAHTQGPQLDQEVLTRILWPVLESDETKKIAHNLKYDFGVCQENGLELGGLGGDGRRQRTELGEQGLGERFDVTPRQGGKQQQFEQFIIGESVAAAPQKALAKALAMADRIRFRTRLGQRGNRLRFIR